MTECVECGAACEGKCEPCERRAMVMNLLVCLLLFIAVCGYAFL